ncbi:CBS domain-containing protein [Alsobacter sp. SYSU BS001988]|jgi:CBS domain-containing protein
MRISEVMTRDAAAIAPERSLREAARIMDDLNVGSLPVVHRGQVVGVITDRDITVRATAAGRDPNVTPVFEIMTDEPHCCFEDEDVSHVVDIMEHLQVRRVPVLDRSRRLVGMVALGDLVEEHAPGAEEALGRISYPARPDRSGTPSSRARRGSAGQSSGQPSARLTEDERRELESRMRRFERDADRRDRRQWDDFRTRDDNGADLDQFERRDREDGRFRFRDEDDVRASFGSAGQVPGEQEEGREPRGGGQEGYDAYGEDYGREARFFRDDSGRSSAGQAGFGAEDRETRGIRTVAVRPRRLTEEERDPEYNRRRDQEGQDDPWMDTVRRLHARGRGR